MLLEWLVVVLIVGVAGYFAVRAIRQTLSGRRACCEAGERAGCQLADLMKKHNLPRPHTCNGHPLTDPDEAYAHWRKRRG